MTSSVEEKISVIIVAYKKIEMVANCIESIYKYNDIDTFLEVIVVDNSPEHEVYVALSTKFTHAKFIKNKNNGFGGGNNVGVNVAMGEYLLFLNPDTILIEPIFQFAISKFQNLPLLGMFGLKLVAENMSRNMSFYLINGGGVLRNLIIKIANFMDFYIDGKMYIAGADIFIRKDDFLKCGRFDEKIFMYYEEPDLTQRLRNIGKKTKYFKNKRIVHLEGGATTDSDLALRRRLDSAIYYSRKFGQNPKILLLRELRLGYIKLIFNKFFGLGDGQQIKRTISVLSEYLD